MTDDRQELIEYGQRLIEELPKLVRQGVERGRKIPKADVDRIADGVLAHSVALGPFSEALDKERTQQ